MTNMACEVCGTKVTQWSARFEANMVHCKRCFGSPAAKRLHAKSNIQNSDNPEQIVSTAIQLGALKTKTPYSFLSLLLFTLATLSLLGGLILSIQLWPSLPGHRQQLATVTYIPALTPLVVGVVQLALFAGLGQGLHLLKIIALNTSKPNE